ncbi:TonB-dependent copper receptor [Erwinia sp. HDF1-3R]|uniref:TonB-dependent copper receptor n=1 Tax=Erwinia sp. HDF1-3R TaxID=3141543 RepID=UPI0031F4A5D1
MKGIKSMASESRKDWSVKKKKLAGMIAMCYAAHINFTYAQETMTVIATPQTETGKVIVNTKNADASLPASDGAGLLSTLPGFSQIRTGASNGDPVLRGMPGSRLNILADGGGMHGGCGSRMDSPTSYISPKNFDLVEIIKGPQTVLWGPMASAGTILFERTSEYFTQPGIKGSVSLLRGNNGRADQEMSVAGGNHNGWLRIDANRSVAGDYKSGDGTTIPGKWNKWNSGIIMGWTPTEKDLVELSVSGGDGEARYAGRGMDGSKFLRKSAMLKVEMNDLSDHFTKLIWRGYYNSTDHVMDNFSLRTPSAMKMSSEVGGIVSGTRLSMEWQKDDTQIVAGVDGQQTQHRKKQTYGWATDAEYRQFGIFTEWQQSLNDQSKTVTGLRIDSIHATDLRQGKSERRQATLPGAFLRFEHILPDMPVKVWSGVGYTERFPDYWELFSGKAGKNSVKKLKNEKTLQWDSGIQYQSDDLHLWLSGWVNKVDDYILFDYSSASSRAENVNAWTTGAEMGSAWLFSADWKLETSLAWVRGENLSQHNALPQISPLETKVALTYSHDKWTSSTSWRGVAHQNRVAKDKGNVIGRDLGRSAGFGVMSWNVNYSATDKLSIGAGIDNIFNKNYAQHLNVAGYKEFGFSSGQRIPEPGRTGWLSLDYTF